MIDHAASALTLGANVSSNSTGGESAESALTSSTAVGVFDRQQRADGEVSGHPVTDRIADNPVGKQILDRAAVDSALGGGVLGDVGQPPGVRFGRCEVPLDMVVEDCRPRCLTRFASALPNQTGGQLSDDARGSTFSRR